MTPEWWIFVSGAVFGSVLTAIGVTYWFNFYMYRKMVSWGWRWEYHPKSDEY